MKASGTEDLDTADTGGARSRWVDALVALWLAAHMVIPLGYYTVRDERDERFAWRMYSAQRAELCRVDFAEVIAGQARSSRQQAISLTRTIHKAWESGLERGRPDIIAAFVAWRCAEGAEQVHMLRRCKSGDGRPLDPLRHAWDCATGAELPLPAPQGPTPAGPK